jgi:hypothetical protein
MNEHRRRFVAGAGALFAGGAPHIVRAKPRAVDPNTGEIFEAWVEAGVAAGVDAWAAQTEALLAGVPVADIPVIQSGCFNFGLDLAACRELGIHPPKALLKIADLVMQ